jgi:hypothetical protein
LKHVLPILCALALASAATAQADTGKRKAGLWEVQTTTNVGGADMSDALAKVPPEQRAMVEQMMKQRGLGAGAKPSSFRYCVSKEQAEKDFQPRTDPDSDCQHTMSPMSGNEVKFSFSCKRKDGSTASGEGRAYDLTPESYALQMSMHATHQGRPMDMKTEQKGHWVGADCGAIKPSGG